MADERNVQYLDDEPKTGVTLGRVLGVIAFIAITIWWIYVFANGSSVEHPDDFEDASWTADAELICEARQQAILDLPTATSAATPQARADLVDLATAELGRMLREIDALGLPATDKGAQIVPRWLTDYELYLQDRRNWAAVLRTGDDPPFLVSGTADGVRVTDLLTTFAEVNEMPSCAPSGDV